MYTHTHAHTHTHTHSLVTCQCISDGRGCTHTHTYTHSRTHTHTHSLVTCQCISVGRGCTCGTVDTSIFCLPLVETPYHSESCLLTWGWGLGGGGGLRCEGEGLDRPSLSHCRKMGEEHILAAIRETGSSSRDRV